MHTPGVRGEDVARGLAMGRRPEDAVESDMAQASGNELATRMYRHRKRGRGRVNACCHCTGRLGVGASGDNRWIYCKCGRNGCWSGGIRGIRVDVSDVYFLNATNAKNGRLVWTT